MSTNHAPMNAAGVQCPVLDGKLECISCGRMIYLPQNKHAVTVNCRHCGQGLQVNLVWEERK